MTQDREIVSMHSEAVFAYKSALYCFTTVVLGVLYMASKSPDIFEDLVTAIIEFLLWLV
jgi:hypothetical protein